MKRAVAQSSNEVEEAPQVGVHTAQSNILQECISAGSKSGNADGISPGVQVALLAAGDASLEGLYPRQHKVMQYLHITETHIRLRSACGTVCLQCT